MGRAPCCDESGLKKGPWTAEEDKMLVDFIERHGHGSWRALPKLAGLNRCGKSCRLRWTNYLRPDIKRGKFTEDEEQTIINLHSVLGNKWSAIAGHLSGRTDNEIKNYWNTHLKKKLLQMGIDPVTHRPRADLSLLANLPHLLAAAANLAGPSPIINPLENAAQLAKLQLLQNILQVLSTNNQPNPNPFHPEMFGNQINNHLLDGIVNPALQFPNNVVSIFEAQGNTSGATNTCVNASSLVGGVRGAMDPNSHLPALVHTDESSADFNNSSAIKQIEREMLIDTKIIKDMSNPCSTTTTTTNTTFEAWNEIMDDEASNSYWKDIIYQTNPSWPTL